MHFFASLSHINIMGAIYYLLSPFGACFILDLLKLINNLLKIDLNIKKEDFTFYIKSLLTNSHRLFLLF